MLVGNGTYVIHLYTHFFCSVFNELFIPIIVAGHEKQPVAYATMHITLFGGLRLALQWCEPGLTAVHSPAEGYLHSLSSTAVVSVGFNFHSIIIVFSKICS